MYRIHFNGITAGALESTLLMPNDQFESHLLIIIGVSDFFTAGKLRHRKRLYWHPQTMLADFDESFIMHSVNFTGYANLIGLDGKIVAVHLFRQPDDRRQITHLRRVTRDRIAAKLTTTIRHRLANVWQENNRQIQLSLTQYRHFQIDFERLLIRLQRASKTLTPSQQPVLTRLLTDVRAIDQDYQHQIDTLMLPAFMITHAIRVGNAMYTNAKYELLKQTLNPEPPNFELVSQYQYRKQLLRQFLAIKQLFEDHNIPFYDPREQQRIADGELLWPEADLHTYTQLGVLPEVT